MNAQATGPEPREPAGKEPMGGAWGNGGARWGRGRVVWGSPEARLRSGLVTFTALVITLKGVQAEN